MVEKLQVSFYLGEEGGADQSNAFRIRRSSYLELSLTPAGTRRSSYLEFSLTPAKLGN
jgi:hypothetical protein